MSSTDNLTIGIDRGDRRHAVCGLSAAGDIVTKEVIANTRECLEALAARFPTATIMMEAATATCMLIEPLLQSLDHLNAQIKRLDAELETLAREKYPIIERFRQISGVGSLTALCFVLTPSRRLFRFPLPAFGWRPLPVSTPIPFARFPVYWPATESYLPSVRLWGAVPLGFSPFSP